MQLSRCSNLVTYNALIKIMQEKRVFRLEYVKLNSNIWEMDNHFKLITAIQVIIFATTLDD